MEALTPADFNSPLDFTGNTSRRVFIKGLGFVSASLLLATLGGCERIAEQIRNRPVRRRLRTGSAEVDADIETYRQAVLAMKGLPNNDARRWLAEATIHGTPSGFNMCEHNSSHFFDWHRAYLFYFEKICQRLTNNPRFGLPYWNWNQNPAIHPAYLIANSTLSSSRTRTTMAGRNSISTGTLDGIFQDTNFLTFQAQLEGTPHNNVHSWIDGTLGQFNSPMDPLFWNHHCMADYCWYKWNGEMGNDNPNDPTWANRQNGQFVDADGNPATISAAVTILMPLLSYRYESSAIGSNPAAAEITSAAEFQRLETRLRAGANVRFLVSQRTRLTERAGASVARPLSLRAPLNAANFAGIVESRTARERVFVQIEYAQIPPSTDFEVRVFVNLPNANAATPSEDPHYAGSFAFFGMPAPGAAEAPPSVHRHQPRFLVDVTQALQRLRARGELAEGAPLSIQLVPTPFDRAFAAADTPLVLNAVDIITTPVLVSTRQQ